MFEHIEIVFYYEKEICGTALALLEAYIHISETHVF